MVVFLCASLIIITHSFNQSSVANFKMMLQNDAVFLFTFLGMGPGPLQLGKIMREMQKLGKITLNSLVFVALKMNYKVLTYFEFLIGNFSGPIGKNGGVLPLGMGSLRPQNRLKRNTVMSYQIEQKITFIQSSPGW